MVDFFYTTAYGMAYGYGHDHVHDARVVRTPITVTDRGGTKRINDQGLLQGARVSSW